MAYDEVINEDTAEVDETEEQQSRADVYRLLAALLASPPREEVLNIVRNIEVSDVEKDKSLTNAWLGLKEIAQQVRADQLKMNTSVYL